MQSLRAANRAVIESRRRAAEAAKAADEAAGAAGALQTVPQDLITPLQGMLNTTSPSSGAMGTEWHHGKEAMPHGNLTASVNAKGMHESGRMTSRLAQLDSTAAALPVDALNASNHDSKEREVYVASVRRRLLNEAILIAETLLNQLQQGKPEQFRQTATCDSNS